MSEYFRKPIVKTLMLKGKDAVSISNIEKTLANGLTDTYDITLTDGTKKSFKVRNGRGIKSIAKTSTSGLVDTYTTTYNDGTTSTFTVKNGEKGDTGSVSNLKIGGRNYILYSDVALTGDGKKELIGISKDFINQNLGKQITISIRYNAENWMGTRFGFEFVVNYGDGTREYYGDWVYDSANGNASESRTILLPTNKGEVKSVEFSALHVQGTSKGTVTVYKPKIELGNIATDWTPSLENIENKIASAKDILNKTYPVGSIYMSVNSTNPSSLFGGTWERLKGRFLIGAGTIADTNSNASFGPLGAEEPDFASGETGGQYYHKLNIDEMPEHHHDTNDYALVVNKNGVRISTNMGAKCIGVTEEATNIVPNIKATKNEDGNATGNEGGGQKHNNMPPYLAVYMWKRTA